MHSQTKKDADFNLIKSDFMSSLEDLTINSKAIISALTILARENVSYGEAVVEAIIDHIGKVKKILFLLGGSQS